MAFGALCPQAALMDIVRLMAVGAAATRVAECALHMTLLARHRHVQAHKGKVREVVIEVHNRTPTFRYVALIAALAESADMNVACPVTTDAIPRQLLRRYAGRMAGVAFDFCVQANQLPTRIARVVEHGGAPFLISMAVTTFGPQTAGMRI